jgi:hypothetical protein
MSWHRGELWLDTDISWFREGTRVPAVAGFAPAAIPSTAPPPGLVASRKRRDAWRRRRYARRARATALAVSPAVMFGLAALRGGGEQSTPVAADDPPSQTLRLGPAATTRPSRDPLPKRVHGVAQTDAPPRIDWHGARSVGLPYGGRLVDGTQLPLEGPDWVTWNPVTDSVPNAARRLYGTDRTIRAIVAVTAGYRAAHPHAPRVVVGDISRVGGGPMWDEHVSHQNGLDVDVYFPRVDGLLRAPRTPEQIDHRLAQDLVDRFVAAGAHVVFVGYSTGLHGPADVVVPYGGHENHMHVRFPPRGA